MNKLYSYLSTILITIFISGILYAEKAKLTDDEILVNAPIAEILQDIKTSGRQATLLNVWATWCQPCVEEMPDLLRLQRELSKDGFQLILISADFSRHRPKTIEMLRDWEVDFRTYFKVDKDEVLLGALHPEWGGALPGTFLYNSKGELVWHHIGKGEYETFLKNIKPLLK